MKMEIKLNEKTNHSLLTLVNALLHSSYQFILLRAISVNLNMNGCTWIAEKKEVKFRDSAVEILNWIQENGGYIDFADISAPKFDESGLDGEFVFARWGEVDRWIKASINIIQDEIETGQDKKKTEAVELLENILSRLTSTN